MDVFKKVLQKERILVNILINSSNLKIQASNSRAQVY